MRCDAVVIEELVMRVPGVRKDDAPALVEEVLRRVQDNLRGSGRIGHYHVAQVKVKVPASAGRADLIDAIAKQLTEALR
jgi:hypothetical protein